MKATKRILSAVLVLAILALLGLGSIYTINTGQEAVIQRFGRYIDTVTKPGINYKIPFIDKKTVVDVNSVHRIEFGFETVETTPNVNGIFDQTGAAKPERAGYADNFTESKMLTGDENIAVVETIIQYQVKNPQDYLFQVDNIDSTLRTVAESTIRRVVANHTLDEALTENKSTIQSEIMTDLQAICDKYSSGIKIVGVQLQDVNPPPEVDEAFRDVAGAREDKNSYINEANAYRNEVIPTARGEAATLVNNASAYANNRVASAEATVTSYEQLYAEYLKGPDVTRSRIYLEAMQEILKGVDLYVMEDGNSMKLFNMNGGEK
ncbi:MAG: FtsH protease activity modulator HflK [Angelakisella sp.]